MEKSHTCIAGLNEVDRVHTNDLVSLCLAIQPNFKQRVSCLLYAAMTIPWLTPTYVGARHMSSSLWADTLPPSLRSQLQRRRAGTLPQTSTYSTSKASTWQEAGHARGC